MPFWYGYRDNEDVVTAIEKFNGAFVDVRFKLNKYEVRKDDNTIRWSPNDVDDERVRTESENQVGSWLELRIFIVANPGGSAKGYSSSGAMGFCPRDGNWACHQEYDGVVIGAIYLTLLERPTKLDIGLDYVIHFIRTVVRGPVTLWMTLQGNPMAREKRKGAKYSTIPPCSL
jgi:hypothetical protein